MTRGNPRIVLASRSPRRAQLLAMLGLEFDVAPADLPEIATAGEQPAAYAERLAREKATHVAEIQPDALVVGSDTIVVYQGDILEKPRDEEEAVRMLLRLQGEEHRVDSAVAIAAPGGRVVSGVESVRVRFRPFGERTAREYAATGEPLDKAGAYGIQGFGATLVPAIHGDYFAVMGLPIVRLLALLEDLGWHYDFTGLARRDGVRGG